MNRITACIIGLGRIGSQLEEDSGRMRPCTHAGALFHFRRINLIAAADIDSQKRDAFCEYWNFSGRMYESGEVLIREETPDLLVVCSSTGTHACLATLAANKGIRGMILEKPIASDLEQARNLLETVKKNGTAVTVCHDRRFYTPYRKIRTLLNKKNFGPLQSLNCEIHSRFSAEADNPLNHDGTHMMDLACFFGGKPIYLDFRRGFPDNEFPAFVSGKVYFENNIVFRYFHESRSSYYDWIFEACGKRGKGRIGNSCMSFEKAENSFLYTHAITAAPNNPYLARTNMMINYLTGKRSTIESGLEHGIQALYLCEKAWKSARNGRAIDLLPGII